MSIRALPLDLLLIISTVKPVRLHTSTLLTSLHCSFLFMHQLKKKVYTSLLCKPLYIAHFTLHRGCSMYSGFTVIKVDFYYLLTIYLLC